MLHKLFSKLDEIHPIDEASAHCDVPCGIYDPITAQIAALTVVRMVDLITEADAAHKEKGVDYHSERRTSSSQSSLEWTFYLGIIASIVIFPIGLYRLYKYMTSSKKPSNNQMINITTSSSGRPVVFPAKDNSGGTVSPHYTPPSFFRVLPEHKS